MTRKTAFFEGWSWFKFNNLGLTLGTNLKFYTSVAKGLKLKVRKFWGLIPMFAEVTGEKLVRGGGGGAFCPSPSWIGLILLPLIFFFVYGWTINRIRDSKYEHFSGNYFRMLPKGGMVTIFIFSRLHVSILILKEYLKTRRSYLKMFIEFCYETSVCHKMLRRITISRSSHRRCSVEKGVFKNS